MSRGEHTSVDKLRRNLRLQLVNCKTTRGCDPSDDWLKEKWPALLDAHCLQDALHMITTGKVVITCPGAKKRKKDEQQEGDDEEPRILSELEKHAIKEWYDTKDKELLEKRGKLYVTERNLSSAARAHNEENMEDHLRTRDMLQKAAKDVLDAQVAMHAAMEDIVSFLGVGLNKKRSKTFAKHDATHGRHVSS